MLRQSQRDVLHLGHMSNPLVAAQAGVRLPRLKLHELRHSHATTRAPPDWERCPSRHEAAGFQRQVLVPPAGLEPATDGL